MSRVLVAGSTRGMLRTVGWLDIVDGMSERDGAAAKRPGIVLCTCPAALCGSWQM